MIIPSVMPITSHRENHGNGGLHNLGKGREFQPNEGKQGVKQDNTDQAQAHQRGKAIAGDSKFQEQRRHCQNAAANQRRNPPRAEKMKKGFHFGNSKQRIVSRPMPPLFLRHGTNSYDLP